MITQVDIQQKSSFQRQTALVWFMPLVCHTPCGPLSPCPTSTHPPISISCSATFFVRHVFLRPVHFRRTVWKRQILKIRITFTKWSTVSGLAPLTHPCPNTSDWLVKASTVMRTWSTGPQMSFLAFWAERVTARASPHADAHGLKRTMEKRQNPWPFAA